ILKNNFNLLLFSALDIATWDLECEFNNTDHRTELNGMDRLIVRRGQPFSIKLKLRYGEYQAGLSSLTCIAETGPSPSDQYGTRAVFDVAAGSDNPSAWSATVTSPPGNVVALSICPAADAPIGRWTLTLGGSCRIDFILLFNPWCSGDSVYMDNEEYLKEYVLSQDGIIYRGTLEQILPFPWNFGQFEYGILDVCLKILDTNPKYLRNPGKDCSGRRNPIYVSRVLSAMVNCNGDAGVVLGRWPALDKLSSDNPYEGGESPMSWKGSVDILLNWDSSSCSPVRYGQCWVFAAVACSVSRALGIPCRVVTNYISAHDTNRNLLIEYFYDENGRNHGRDMIWTFHCWVENWMTRPDLKPEYDGWQVVDPTPQEKSEGVYCCGPVSVKAVKEGELATKYDAPFVFAEVNADKVDYIRQADGSNKKMTSFTGVGQKISTKSVGNDRREDITHLYKYPEGSEEERETFRKADHLNKLLHRQESQGLKLAIEVAAEKRKGCDFDVIAVASNSTTSEKKCRLLFSSMAVSYTGVVKDNCGFKDLLNVELPPGGERRVPLRLNYSKYCDALTEDNLIRLAALLVDYSTKETIFTLRDIVLDNPEIKVRILGEPKQNRKLAAEITVQNPLPVPLSNCCFSIEGANLTGGKTIKERLESTVEPGEDAKVKIYFKPNHSGLRKLVVDFNSSKLCHVKGYKNVIIGK
uniref:Protein-glutamine gamma-glutamyltransferase 2 n=1 Tax=Gadus morhua TaxID=8049 RepID=A0A8C5AC86_GADMO